MKPNIVDTTASMAKLLSSIAWLDDNPPPLYLDIEGTDLCRYGTIAIIQLFVLPLNEVYLIDIAILGATAFSTPSDNNTDLTFKTVLEWPAFTKVFFDVRNDSDALFHLYGIKLAGVHDLQILELAWYDPSKQYLSGLAACIQRHSDMSPTEKEKWRATKDLGRKLYTPETGGSYEVFAKRPLAPDIIAYCVQDVVVLPGLWKKYMDGMQDWWVNKMLTETKARIAVSQGPTYHGKGKENARSPWYCPYAG